jgi:serine/threonine protein kinase/tetratricopeptide (TPR) repeat protein
MSDPSSALDAIVRRARSLSGEDQLSFLRSACGNDSTLFSQALNTLNPDHGGAWWDDSSDSSDLEKLEEGADLVGSVIGHYRVVRTLGRGGMGQVLLAERADRQFQHQVAIKLVRNGLLSKQVQGRLKIERQILAALDHPNIAKLLDGGTTANGLPYIVMEYIDGKPIDDYCNERRLAIRERLELFRVVCSAVHYAHQNLIVHRDLKPSNILVTADGAPKLLDFGIAKLLDSRQLTAHTMAVTHFDSRMLTPDHASPEQVRGELITTASDTYVLGVLLYELLTGRKPIPVKHERLSELERAICEAPPLPLDYGLRNSEQLPANFLIDICTKRSTTPARLRRELAGDLSNIVGMALRKEPERRYASVEQFSADIGRYLDGMPIAARRDTWSYRAHKFVARHAFIVTAAVLAVAALSAFAVVTRIQAQRIEQERANSEEVSAFLINLFEQADPERSRGGEITVAEVLDAASRRLSDELESVPSTRARLLATLGTVYGNLGKYTEAEKALRTTLQTRRQIYAPNDPAIADSERRLGAVLTELRQDIEAEALLESALRIDAEAFGEQSKEVATSLHSLARLRQVQERFTESQDLFARAVAILEAEPKARYAELALVLNDWALLLSYQNDFAGAEGLYRKALRLAHDRLGIDHPHVAQSTHNLAVALDRQGKLAQAEPLYIESIAQCRRIYGNSHPQTANALANYGRFLQKQHNYVAAEQVLEETVALQTAIYGPSHVNTAYARVNLGLLFIETQRPELAEQHLKTALAIYAQHLPPDHQYVGAAQLGLGRALIALNRPRDAMLALQTALSIAEREYSENSPALAGINAALGGALLAQGRLQDAEPLLRDSYPVLLAVRGERDVYATQVRDWINALYVKMGDASRANEYFASLSQNSPSKVHWQPR